MLLTLTLGGTFPPSPSPPLRLTAGEPVLPRPLAHTPNAQIEEAAQGRDAEMDVVESELRLTIIRLQAEAESMRQQMQAKVEVQASLEDRIADLNAALQKEVCV